MIHAYELTRVCTIKPITHSVYICNWSFLYIRSDDSEAAFEFSILLPWILYVFMFWNFEACYYSALKLGSNWYCSTKQISMQEIRISQQMHVQLIRFRYDWHKRRTWWWFGATCCDVTNNQFYFILYSSTSCVFIALVWNRETAVRSLLE